MNKELGQEVTATSEFTGRTHSGKVVEINEEKQMLAIEVGGKYPGKKWFKFSEIKK